MSHPVRITAPLLDVLEALLDSFATGSETHGWAMAKQTKRSGPTVYNVVSRLEGMGWVTSRWEEQEAQLNRPRRRLYRLSPDGAESARVLLAERRPAAVRLPATDQPGTATGFAFRRLLVLLRRALGAEGAC
jgi:PadR family transcriptional regulator, regulatory protein PadR